jgi:hypothetical protein
MVIQPEQMLFLSYLSEENDYDCVRDCLEHVEMDENPAYQRTSGDVEMEENPTYQRTSEDVEMQENPAYEVTSQINSTGLAPNEQIGLSDYI